ncbi:uncharacterized protein LOC119464238 isoform X9 [Dermacentor silvarum]|uniref:uncharacterized protein LOC119464238 isoform X9 n=1 Tax=Dermacentor silvarum TaxID=543639 RepID=UPI00189ADE59|nr:uncharacterized protein LOC119464238 isoform X9 [Dermacentor silvarum]
MGTLVTYRDLPGGPTKIKFADEISRHCLCRKCQMLSLCMYTDTASHMFCDNCLNDQSYKHKKYEIYCPDERKEVSLAEMFEARDLVTILRDQYVECPNQPKCTVKLPLGQLENHYIECKEISSIKCTKCGQEVPSTLWIEHKTKCQVTCDEFTLKASDNRGAKRKPPPASSASPPFSSSRKNKSTKSTTAAASLPYPSSQRADATTGELNQQFPQIGHASTSTQPSVKPKFPTSAEPEKTTCKHCERKVKESNMPRHLEVCYKIPVPCPYCEKAISRSDLKAHVEQCEREFEARKTSDATAASSEKLNKSKKTKVAPPKRDENPPLPRTNSKANKKQKKETTKTMRDGDSSHPGTYSNAQAAYSGSKTSITVEGRGTPGESSSHTGQEPQLCSGWSTNVDTWLPHATAGNWYAAYVAIEEQFKDTRTKQAARYAHFVPKLITLKLDHMVRDFIDAPYEPQPFDCLITALFARACLPLNVWPQGSEVTWDDILKYVPSVLHSRLSEDAKLYLRRHPVIPKDLNYVMVDEVGIDAAEADVPGDTSSVTSSNRAITETEASDAPEEDMRYLAAAKQPELDPLQALGKETRMGADVEYRDLPGGTHKLRFADELPRHVMCGTCGMLSMRMYEDEQGHAFCNVCVCRGSPAEAIFCKYENRNVSVDQLTEAFDIIQVIKDQVVFCPNEEKGCPVYSPLCKIEDHYLQCEKTEIDCLQCQQRIKGCHWKSHSKDCPRKIVQCRFCVAAFPQIDLQTHEALCAENPNCITSSTLQHSYPSNFSALTVPAAQTENGSEHVSFSSAELDLPSDTTSDMDEGERESWSLTIRNLRKNILTCLSIVGNFPLASFLRRNPFTRNFGLPFFTLVCIALLVRCRRHQ